MARSLLEHLSGESMRPAVLAAAFAFHPRLSWVRSPLTTFARLTGPLVLRWLDRRREQINLE
ncbi:MAG TPA: hypothetical protein ENK18_01945 [Deltaproteobacteria bacterium]|nr:hypothetical protein [Deltaproteobacteria bacterium]